MTTLQGSLVVLRPVERDDTPALIAIRRAPEVFDWWRGGNDLAAAVAQDLAEVDATPFVIDRHLA